MDCFYFAWHFVAKMRLFPTATIVPEAWENWNMPATCLA